MGIKRQFETEMKQKEIMRMMGAAFRTIAEERVEMETIVEEVDDLIDMDINERRAENNIVY